MATRELLALSKIDEFADWAVHQGFTRNPTKGDYEVLRLQFEKQKPIIFFQRLSTRSGGNPIHATAQHDGAQLVRRWLRTRKVSHV